jgi:hypothetical protein
MIAIDKFEKRELESKTVWIKEKTKTVSLDASIAKVICRPGGAL